MELMSKKKEAAKRKERYMKDCGGLKYTAIAMANME
jgi:predicted methyltransferase